MHKCDRCKKMIPYLPISRLRRNWIICFSCRNPGICAPMPAKKGSDAEDADRKYNIAEMAASSKFTDEGK